MSAYARNHDEATAYRPDDEQDYDHLAECTGDPFACQCDGCGAFLEAVAMSDSVEWDAMIDDPAWHEWADREALRQLGEAA